MMNTSHQPIKLFQFPRMFVVLYTHFIRADGWKHSVPPLIPCQRSSALSWHVWYEDACERSSGRRASYAIRMPTSSKPDCATGARC
jgi:hypothetical protein